MNDTTIVPLPTQDDLLIRFEISKSKDTEGKGVEFGGRWGRVATVLTVLTTLAYEGPKNGVWTTTVADEP